MAFNQIGFAGQPAAARNASFLQNTGQQIVNQTYGGVYQVALAPGQTFLIPEGQWTTQAGPYSDVQYYDAQSQIWRVLTVSDSAPTPLSSDGTNYRFANLSGCPVGAVVTTAGTAGSLPVSMYTATGVWTGGYFTAQATPAVGWTVSAGGSTWNTFIGGAINTSVTITAAGSGYNVAPKIIVVPPSTQGSQPFIPASAICTISGGAINAVTVTNQGAGYVAAPTFLILNQPGDTTGSGAVLTPALTGTGQVTAVVMATPGTVQTSVPTLTGTGTSLPASAAATMLMNFSLTASAGASLTAGSGYTGGYQLYVTGGMNTAASAVYTNPAIEKGITTQTQPYIYCNQTSVNSQLNSANVFSSFWGSGYQIVPPTAAAVGLGTGGNMTTLPVGGQNDACLLYPL